MKTYSEFIIEAGLRTMPSLVPASLNKGQKESAINNQTQTQTSTATATPTTRPSLMQQAQELRAMRMRSMQRQGNTAGADQIRKTLPSSVAGASDERAKELERIRGSAALKSIQSSPLGNRILSGGARSPEANRIAQQSIERSGVSRDKLVAASSNKSEFDKLLSAPPAKPTSTTQITGEKLDSKTGKPVITAPVSTQKPTSTTLTDAQLKQYQRAYSNRNNPLARGEIRRVYSSLTPEQQKAFKEYAASQNHDWGDLIK